MEQDISISEDFFRGIVTDVSETEHVNDFGFTEGEREVTLRLKDGKEMRVMQSLNLDNENDNAHVEEGMELLLVRTTVNGEGRYDIVEPYRLDGIVWLFLLFVLMVGVVARKKGLLSFLGLAISFLILGKWLVPMILAGYSPTLVSFFASVMIATVTFFLSHGIEKKTVLALFSTLVTLVIAFLMAWLTIEGLQLFGTGSEEAVALGFGEFQFLNLKGLLLGAIIIGTLGVLDDVTITQVATVTELHEANKKLSMTELYRRGLAVGRDHIASIINTLVLAYVGASFPLFVMMIGWPRPLWVVLNSEMIAEEIARTLIGSMTLVLAIPFATLVAAYYYAGRKEG